LHESFERLLLFIMPTRHPGENRGGIQKTLK